MGTDPQISSMSFINGDSNYLVIARNGGTDEECEFTIIAIDPLGLGEC